MESPAHSELAYSLTRYYFGDDVASVIKTLFGYDQMSLRHIRSIHPEIKLDRLKKAMLILVKYQLVDYVRSYRNFSQQHEYSLVPRRVFQFFRIPKYIHSLRLKKGKMYVFVLAAICYKGLIGEEKLIEYVKTKSEKDSELKLELKDIREIFDQLVLRKFVVRMGSNVCINIERMYRDNRDDVIVETVDKFYNCDAKIKAICRSILTISYDNTSDDAPITAPVPTQDLRGSLCPDVFPNNSSLDKYLQKLTSEANFRFFIPSGNHPVRGAMYALNIGLVIDYLMKEHICSVITTRFGPKCCRVFRVLLMKGPSLLRQIEESIMLPAKDVREYTYMLIKEGFIRNRQVPKTPDNAPGKSVFIMSVELERVVYNLADLCCRSISNLLTRHEFELKKNQPLLTRSNAVKELLMNNNESIEETATSELEVWNQYFNSHEMAQLNQINRTLNRILFAKAQVEETLFLTHVWLRLKPNMDNDNVPT